MEDPNDSDGSWEFVAKDTDSDTSSETAPYDTGLPEEEGENAQNEDLAGSAWNNQDESITDSDIEACAEEPAESDNEADVTVIQAVAQMSGSEHDDLESSMQRSRRDTSSSSDTLTKSMLSDDEKQPLQSSEKVETDDKTQPATGEDEVVGTQDSQRSQHHTKCNESGEEVLTSQENASASLNDDIIASTHIDSGPQPTSPEVLDSLSPLSNVSSHSDFERIASSSDLAFDPEPTDEAQEPRAVDEVLQSDHSDAGSVDFTVISAPASPPVEITSHETETIQCTEDGNTVSTNQRDVGMVTEIQLANQEKVDMATGPDEPTLRTVGIVTDHHTAPPNQRLLISIIMISFGVGFLLGRCPLPSSTVFLQYEEHYAPIDKTDIEETPQSIQHIYHGDDQPQKTGHATSSEYMDSLVAMLSKSSPLNELVRYKLSVENSKLRNRNRRLRSNIRKLKTENTRIMTEQLERYTATDDTAMALDVLRQTCKKQQRHSELSLANKERELQQIRARLEAAEQDNVFFNQSMTLYKRLQSQHSELLALHQTAIAKHATEKESLDERIHGMKLRLQRYRRESKGLIQQVMRVKNYNWYLEMLAQQKDILTQPDPAEKSDTMSPLVKALTHQSQTCRFGSKFSTQIKWLKSKVAGQRSAIGKLEQDGKLKTMALEMLYNSFGELTNFASCLKRQIQILPQERAREALAICKSTARGAPTESDPTVDPNPEFTPQCSYPINGTLAMDFTSINITVQTFSENLPTYELKLLSDKVKPNLVFNATSMCDLTFNPNLTSDPSNPEGHFIPKTVYTQLLKRNAHVQQDLEARTAEFSTLQKVCKASNRSLEVSRKKRENVQNQLIVAKNELKRLRKEKKELNRKLNNATSELKKKSSVKNCLKSVLNTEDLLNHVNGSKAYNAASRMAHKVKKASNKAWRKFKRFVNKFGSSEHHDDFDDNGKHSQEFHEKKKPHHDSKAHKRPQAKKHRDRDDDDDDFYERHRHHETKKAFGPQTKKQHKAHRESQKTHKSKKQHHESNGRNQENNSANKNQHKSHESRKIHEKKKQHHQAHEQNHGKEKQKQQKNEKEPKFFSQDPKHAKNPEHPAKIDRKSQEKEEKDGKKFFFDHRHEKKPKKGSGNLKFDKERDDTKRNSQQGQKHHKKGKDEKLHQFGDALKKHMEMAKEAGQSMAHHLMPIYDKWQKVYCDIEKKVSQKSFTEIWESLGKMANGEQGKARGADELSAEDSDDSDSNWHWSLYQNITEFLLPIIEIPGKLELPAWGLNAEKEQWIEPTPSRSESKTGKKTDGNAKVEKTDENDLKDQWFMHMFQAREELRKEWGESPLSEEEFDWFLHMFEAREELRNSEEGEYPSYHHDSNNDHQGNRNDIDWFLKMFEDRARLRFENSEDKKNWYLRMIEARKMARSEVKYQRSEDGNNNWYAKMFEARENMRHHDNDDDDDYKYHKMKAERNKAKKANQDGDWYSKRMKSREKSRDKLFNSGSSEEWCQA